MGRTKPTCTARCKHTTAPASCSHSMMGEVAGHMRVHACLGVCVLGRGEGISQFMKDRNWLPWRAHTHTHHTKTRVRAMYVSERCAVVSMILGVAHKHTQL